MIRRALLSDTQQIEYIYNVCFPGEPDFCAWYFKNIYQPARTWVYVQEGEIVACVQDLLTSVALLGQSYKCGYIYAAGTLPQYRGQGIMARLLARCFEDDLEENCHFSLLITQNESLFAFYKQFGYDIISRVSYTQVSPEKLKEGFSVRPAEKQDFSHILRIYRHSVHQHLAFERSQEHFAQMADLYQDNFRVLLDNDNTVKAYAFTEDFDDQMLISEGFGPEIAALAAEIARLSGKRCTMRSPAPAWGASPIGCIKPLTDEGFELVSRLKYPPYLNIMFN